MSLVTDHWQKVSRIVDSAMSYEIADGILQTGDAFLSARIDALVRDSRLEIRGAPPATCFQAR